jgi:hypothetical protein
VALAIADEVGHPRHRPVLVHHLADDAGRIQPGHAGEVDGGFRLSGPLQDTARASLEWEDVARLDEILRPAAGIDRHLDRVRSVMCGDAGRDAFPGLDRNGEGRAVGRLVLVRHRQEPELVAALLVQAEADQAPGVGGHEVDRLRGRELRCDREVALVLPVGGVDNDYEPARTDVL